ncbi:MAG: GNAT family N-acetyltransferase [Saprospiraceae bacterium]|nr:GNAT family N-acetyltransferase [Saprospiraceae bacterium]
MLETDRLIIRPLNRRQLLQYFRNDGSFEAGLKLPPSRLVMTPDLKEAFELSILPYTKDHLPSRFYYTLWSIIRKSEPCLVGDLCFKGPPNPMGEIEIGYGTYPDFQGQGYMTEAVGGLIGWAFSQPDVSCIFAETEKSNPASMRILQKNNFQLFSQTGETCLWRIEKLL